MDTLEKRSFCHEHRMYCRGNWSGGDRLGAGAARTDACRDGQGRQDHRQQIGQHPPQRAGAHQRRAAGPAVAGGHRRRSAKARRPSADHFRERSAHAPAGGGRARALRHAGGRLRDAVGRDRRRHAHGGGGRGPNAAGGRGPAAPHAPGQGGRGRVQETPRAERDSDSPGQRALSDHGAGEAVWNLQGQAGRDLLGRRQRRFQEAPGHRAARQANAQLRTAGPDHCSKRHGPEA